MGGGLFALLRLTPACPVSFTTLVFVLISLLSASCSDLPLSASRLSRALGASSLFPLPFSPLTRMGTLQFFD